MSSIFHFQSEGISQSTEDLCLQYPWFTKLSKDNSLHPIQTPGRQAEPGTPCLLFSKTLNTEDTVPACQSFYKAPIPIVISFQQPPLQDYLGEIQSFYAIDNGLDGYEGICHGGFLSATLDHTMAVLARAYPGAKNAYTKCLRIEFRKHLKTPGAVLCRAWMTKIEGRKMWVTGRIEDENGNAYLTAEGLFLKGGQARL